MKTKLNIGERLAIIQILPSEGNFLTLKVVRDLKEKLGIKEEEFKIYDIKQDGSRVSWNQEGLKEIEFELGEKSTEIIKESLKELNENKKLSEIHFSIFEKFME